jgi:erythromycin esterase-like protein
LIEQHGFTIVAVEADWPDAAVIDRHVRHRPARAQTSLRSLRKLDGGAESPFQRFPQLDVAQS